jgi:hypothetical protein
MPVVPDQGEFVRLSSMGVFSSMGVPPMELSLKSIDSKELAAEAASPVRVEMSLALSALEQLAIAKRDLALSRGGVDPAVAEELFNLLARPANLLMLSRTSNGLPLALAVFDALARNKPVPLGEMTGVQVLTRNIPGEDGALEDLRERMISLASGKQT